MTLKDSYSGLQIGLHWSIALLIIANYFISDGMPEAFDAMMAGKPVTGWVPEFHVVVGTMILGLVVLRLVVRLVQGAPVEHSKAGSVSARLAKLGHLALYVLMLVVPAFGAIAWYGKTESTANLHVLTMNVMMILAVGHAAVALLHHYVLKDGVLNRMTRAN